MDELNWSQNPYHCVISSLNFSNSSFGSFIRICHEVELQFWETMYDSEMFVILRSNLAKSQGTLSYKV